MLPRKILVFLVSAVLVNAIQQSQLENVNHTAVAQCCSEISQQWPDLVDSSNLNQHYYAIQQVDIHPQCRFTPLSPSDVSAVVDILNENSCAFAVKSGGHGVWAGHSNIEGGVVVDFTKMRSIEVDSEQRIARLEPGATWEEVYQVMDAQNISVSGGRIATVGVGGYLLGGGISFLSYERGFACDSIVNYQIILSNGTIVEANATSNSDLYWALKLGSTNYGIVTRFDVVTYDASSQIYAGAQAYGLSDDVQEPLLEKWLSYIANLTIDPKVAGLINLNGSAELEALIRVYLDPENADFSSYVPDTPVVDTMGFTNTADFIESIENVCGVDKRVSWYTITVSAELSLMEDLLNRTQQEHFSLSSQFPGVEFYTTLQPISKGFTAGSQGNPVHSVLAERDEDLVLVVWYALWDDPAYDVPVDDAVVAFGNSVEEDIRQQGLLNDFLYLNYANKRQAVYDRSVSKDSLSKMIEAKQKYDPENVFGRLWHGGYKLPQAPETVDHRREL